MNERERSERNKNYHFNNLVIAGMVPGGFGRLLANKSCAEISILVSVEKDGANALRNDPLLNKYATFVKVIH